MEIETEISDKILVKGGGAMTPRSLKIYVTVEGGVFPVDLTQQFIWATIFMFLHALGSLHIAIWLIDQTAKENCFWRILPSFQVLFFK